MPQVKSSDRDQGQYALDIDTKRMIPLQEVRCQGCGRFLCYQAMVWGVLRIKCTNSKCKKWTTIDISPK